MSKGPAKLIGFVLSYTVVAYVALVILGGLAGGEIGWHTSVVAALFIALATVVLDEKGTVPAGTMMVVRILLVPVTLAWLYLAWLAITAPFPESGALWHPLVVLAFFAAPVLLKRHTRKRRRP